jgi:hypothetical protein
MRRIQLGDASQRNCLRAVAGDPDQFDVGFFRNQIHNCVDQLWMVANDDNATLSNSSSRYSRSQIPNNVVSRGV